MNDFATAIRFLRLRNGLTQDELAKNLGLSKSTISMYEGGSRKPEYETPELIADYFNADMNFLTGKSEKPPENIEGHKKRLMEIFDKVPEESKAMVVGMIEAALKSQGLL
jgi:repressor LexA